MYLTIIIQSFILPVRFLDLDSSFEPMEQYCVHIRYIWDDGGWRGVDTDDEVIQ